MAVAKNKAQSLPLRVRQAIRPATGQDATRRSPSSPRTRNSPPTATCC